MSIFCCPNASRIFELFRVGSTVVISQTDIQTSMEMLFPVYEGSVVGRPTYSMEKDL
jgi:hypothetical protein